MPPLPPAADVLHALHQTVLPAAAGAALVMAAALCLGRWAAALGSAVAVAAGFAFANFTFTALAWTDTGRVIPWTRDADGPAWHGIPRAAAILLAVGLLSRWLGLAAARTLDTRHWWGPPLLVWAARVGAVAVIAPGLVPDPLAADHVWLRPAFVAVVLAVWSALDGTARSGAGSETAAYLGAAFVAAGVVILYAHSARFMDIAVMCGCACTGVAIAAFPTRADASGVAPLGAVALPALLLNARYQLDSQVPLTSFLLPALAPLALLPFRLPAAARLPAWAAVSLRAILVLTALVVAVVLAGQYEKLPFEDAPVW